MALAALILLLIGRHCGTNEAVGLRGARGLHHRAHDV